MKANFLLILALPILLLMGFFLGRWQPPITSRLPSSDVGPVPGKSAYVPSPAALPIRNGIDPKVADQYWEKWHFVSSRFRTDNRQIRIVYANDIAWDAMLKHSPVYPDGAMFAKAIFESSIDPTFPSSVVPKAYTELELMKKDAKNLGNNGGWAYAVYEYEKTTQELRKEDPHNPRELMQTCISCHAIVKSRDYVFSQPAFLQWHRFDQTLENPLFKEGFQERTFNSLAPKEKEILRRQGNGPFPVVKVFKVPALLWGQRFALHSLARFTREEGVPYLMLGENPFTYLLTVPLKKNRNGSDKSVEMAKEEQCLGFSMTTHDDRKLERYGQICRELLHEAGLRPVPQ